MSATFRSRTLAAALGLVATVLATAQSSPACPSCPPSREARREVARDHFTRNAVVSVLPFLVIGAVCARAEAIGRRPGGMR